MLARTLRTLILLALVTGATRAVAQIPGAELTQIQVTRESLLDLQQRLEEAAASGTYSGELRARARELADRVRQRLADGDFQVGDRVYLQVEAETALTDTFVVRQGRVLRLPGIPDISVQGVLRSELAGHLTRELGQYVRSPVVRTQSLIRVTVTGAVGSQGFYTVPVEAGVNDVLLAAGGVAGTAKLDRIRIERGEEMLYRNDEVERVITLGATLDALGVQAGDRFIVPAQTPRNWWQTLQALNIFITLPLSILAVTRAF
jgi:protein involved in polysaccharide export with SLBB domain